MRIPARRISGIIHFSVPSLAWLLAVPAALISPAHGGERPLLRPSHDVSVTYRIEGTTAQGTEKARTVQMYWTGHGSLLRLDMPGQTGFVLVDFTSNRMILVVVARKGFVDVPFSPTTTPGLNIPPDVGLTPVGTGSAAGTACTEWEMAAPGHGGTACITSDGLVLRIRPAGAPQPVLEATSVSYGPQPASLFAVPSGFQPLKPSG